jgi:DNA polymerase III sliding clamp (beta) subunit (PCNA family)
MLVEGLARLFRVTYSAASKFKYITQTLAKINDEGIIGFTQEGLIAWIMSPDKTSLAILNAPTLSFDEYSVENHGSIGLNLAMLFLFTFLTGVSLVPLLA